GLVSLDEYNLANGDSTYLENDQVSWTLTPNNEQKMWYMSSAMTLSNLIHFANGVRPVINIVDSITISSGTGTIQDPFCLEDRSIIGNLNDHSLIGEYVTYAGRNYRVVETSSQGTKLILDGYYDSNNDSVIEDSDKMLYNSNGTNTCTLCTVINEESFINW